MPQYFAWFEAGSLLPDQCTLRNCGRVNCERHFPITPLQDSRHFKTHHAFFNCYWYTSQIILDWYSYGKETWCHPEYRCSPAVFASYLTKQIP